MARPSKIPPAPDAVAPAAAKVTSVAAHEPEAPLSPTDIEFLCSLDPRVAGDARVRADMLALLMEPETVEALVKYAPVLAAVGIDVMPVVKSVPVLQNLLRVRRRMELTQVMVNRHIQTVGSANMSTASDLHRFVESTPESSAMRVAFSLFLEQWQDTFRGPGRAPKAEASPAEPAPADSPARPK